MYKVKIIHSQSKYLEVVFVLKPKVSFILSIKIITVIKKKSF